MNTKPSGIDAREAFRPVAAKYRKIKRAASFVILPVFAFTGVVMFFLPIGYMLAVGACFLVVAIVAHAITPKLTCPVCHLAADTPPDAYCPVCGYSSIGGPRSDRSWPKCDRCGTKLAHVRGNPYYRVRYCTHCAAHLDDDGL